MSLLARLRCARRWMLPKRAAWWTPEFRNLPGVQRLPWMAARLGRLGTPVRRADRSHDALGFAREVIAREGMRLRAAAAKMEPIEMVSLWCHHLSAAR